MRDHYFINYFFMKFLKFSFENLNLDEAEIVGK